MIKNKLEIFKNGCFTKIDPNKAPRTFKELRGFLLCNGGNDCFVKQQGKIWRITKDNKLMYVCRTLPELAFADYLELSKIKVIK